MEWSNDAILDFLECYKNEPIIWKASLPNHKNRNEVYEAWKRIEKEMGQRYTVIELKKKKESLMASFRSCCSKIKTSIRNGAKAEDVYKPNWFAYQKMASFLGDKDLQGKTINSEDILSHDESELEDYDEEGTVDIQESVPLIENENESFVLPSMSKSTFNPPLRKIRKRCEGDELKNKFNNSNLESTLQKFKEKRVCDLYGELVAAKLHALDEYCREIAMHRIDNLLFEIKMNSIVPGYHQHHENSNISGSPK